MRKPTPASKAQPAHGGDGQLRIIAGQWRSRQFNFPMAAGLRPTPNRVRETLFNWLAPYVEGAKVLDLFAGSGALVLEALSRGAGSALALDLNPAAINSLRSHLQTLGCDNGQLLNTDAIWNSNRPPRSTWSSLIPLSTRTCCKRPVPCWKKKAGWQQMRGSIPKAKTRRPALACPAPGVCTASKRPVRCITRSGSEAVDHDCAVPTCVVAAQSTLANPVERLLSPRPGVATHPGARVAGRRRLP